jgi:hypothetical protein
MKNPVFEIITDDPKLIQLSFAGNQTHFDTYLTPNEFEGFKAAIKELPQHLNELCPGHSSVDVDRKKAGALSLIQSDKDTYELQFVDWNNSVWAQIMFSKKGCGTFQKKILNST